MSFLEIQNLTKIYNQYDIYPKVALNQLSMKIEKKDFICIMGASGSGKTTLVNILSTIDQATSGTVLIDGKNILLLSEKEKALMRKTKIGFIFQNYNLIESMTIKDNILFSLRINHEKQEIQRSRLETLTQQLDIQDILHKYPSQCSGGQQQRAAIARAMIMKPEIIFADEPTGNLDSLNAKELMNLFVKINKENDTTIIMVTHDSLVASYSSKMYYMKDGQINISIERKTKSHEDYYREIIAVTSEMNLESK